MEEKITTPALKGLIISLGLIAIGLIFHFAGLSKIKALNYLQYLIFGGALIWACISYANQNNNNVTFGNTFAHGFKTSAAITAIMVIYTIISVKFIMPEIIDYAIEEARKAMAEKKNLTDEQIEQALGMTKKFFLPFAIAGVIVGYLILGAIFSLIGAAIAKKNPNYNPLEKN